MALAGIDFIDNRVTGEAYQEVKKTAPLGQMPILTLPNGTVMTQCRAISRYLAKLATVDGKLMYPEDPMEAYFCDEIMDATMDVQRNMAKTFTMKGDEMVNARANLFNPDGGLCWEITTKLQTRIVAHGKKFTTSDSLNVGDIIFFTWMNSMRSGFLDHIPSTFLEAFPDLLARVDLIASHPQVAAYYQTHKENKMYDCFQAK